MRRQFPGAITPPPSGDFFMSEIEHRLTDAEFSSAFQTAKAVADQTLLNPYDPAQVEELLDVLRKLLPSALSVRTDRMFVKSRREGAAPERIIFEDGGREPLLSYSLASGEDGQRKMIYYIRGTAGLSEYQASELVRATDGLIALNPMGAWSLQSDPMLPLVMSETMFADRTLEADEFTGALVRNLADILPDIDHIEITNQHRGKRRKQWCQFINRAGMEVTTIDTGAFTMHSKALVVRPKINLIDVNLFRCMIWSRQLGCRLRELPEVFHEISFATATGSATRIQF
jgi:hypothetical protein